jgi:hypothetical protein
MDASTHAGLLRLIGSLAMDVHDRWTIVEHVSMLGVTTAEQVLLIVEISDHFGFEASGYDNQIAYLDHLHSVMGYRHQSLLADLRELAMDDDPAFASQDSLVQELGYGYARNSRRDRDLWRSVSLTKKDGEAHPEKDPRLLINILAEHSEVSSG